MVFAWRLRWARTRRLLCDDMVFYPSIVLFVALFWRTRFFFAWRDGYFRLLIELNLVLWYLTEVKPPVRMSQVLLRYERVPDARYNSA